MDVIFSRRFRRMYKKLERRVKTRFEESLALFLQNPFHPILRNHTLHGKYTGCFSINITGDHRAIYEPMGNLIKFVAIGTHTELYGS